MDEQLVLFNKRVNKNKQIKSLDQQIIKKQIKDYIIKKKLIPKCKKTNNLLNSQLFHYPSQFKIKLMQKESQLKTIQAKLKKIEFKHSRDLKQLKISQQRAKDLLKKQKTKLDKITEQAKKHQQQNTLLQHRLNQLKEQKDKEIQNTRNKYNTIKQQVRSYERILPTHTFLTQIGAQIDQLPTYEDIFNNLKEKSFSFDNLTTKHEQFKEEMQEKIGLMQKNEEELTKKIAEKQRMVKQMLPRVIELQSLISDYKYQLQDAATKILDTEQELQSCRHKVEQLQNENKDLKGQIQEILQAHNTQLQNKQQQIRQLTDSEFKRYEDEIMELNNRSEMKQQSYIQQISIYEEQVHELQSRLVKQKQRHQQNYQQIKQIMQNLKSTLQNDKRTISQLQQKNSQLNKDLFQSGTALEKLELQLMDLKKDKEETEHQLRQSESQRQFETTELNEKDALKRELEYKIEELMQEVNRVSEEKRVKEDENIVLVTELEELKYRMENGSIIAPSGRLSIPQNIQMGDDYEPVRRRKPTNFSIMQDVVYYVGQGLKSEQKMMDTDSIQKLSQDHQSRSRKPSAAFSQKFTHEANQLKIKISDLQGEIQNKNKELKETGQKISVVEEKVKQFQKQILEKNSAVNEVSQALRNSETRQSKLKEDLMALNNSIKQHQVQIQDFRSNEMTLKKKNESLKVAIQNLTSENTELQGEIKQEKQQKQLINQEIQEIKAKQLEQLRNKDKLIQGSKNEQKMHIQKLSVAMEEQYNQIQVIRSKNQQLQKNLSTKITQLKETTGKVYSLEQNIIELEESIQRANQTIHSKNQLINTAENQQAKLKQEIADISKSVKLLKVQIENLKSAEFILKQNLIESQETSKIKIQCLTHEINELKVNIEKEKQQNQASSKEIINTKAKINEDAKFRDNSISQKNKQVLSLKAKKQQLVAQIQSKDKDLTQSLNKISSLQENLLNLQKRLQNNNISMTQTIELLKTSQTKLKQDNTQLSKTIKQLQSQEQDLKSNENTLRKKNDALKVTIESLTTENTTLKNDIKKEKQQKQSLTQEIKEIKSKQLQELTTKDKSGKQLGERIKELSNKASYEQKAKIELLAKEKIYQSQIVSLKQQTEKLTSKISELQKQLASSSEKLQESFKSTKQLKKTNERLKYEVTQLQEQNKQKDRQIEMINDSLERQRKERTLITVPSLASLQAEQQSQQEENFKEHYNTIGQKEGQIYMLQREVSNLKEELQELKLTHKTKVQDMETEQNEYIQEIIVMKLKVAESQMKAAEKEHLYNQLKKKLKTVENSLKQSSSPSSSK